MKLETEGSYEIDKSRYFKGRPMKGALNNIRIEKQIAVILPFVEPLQYKIG